MRPAHLLGSLALSSLAVVGVAGAAVADEQPSLSITPSPGRPGGTVVVSLSGGCSASSATATSDAFTGSVPLSKGSAGVYTGNATIRSNATPGNHTVDVDCPGGATSTFTIRIASASPTSSPTPTGVRGGLGGAQGGTTSTDIAIGVGMVALAGAGTVLVLRRRARANA
ncbi:hypothetical protein [Streptomyces cavernicola]|uniref:Gram-positive cocci surface proteins LPxTG domain-containing protein n=1 Tax=Streptomyces cavernicola TaxID=3043613 RepID=A0ABT6SDH6_9ACTN|nr:hypothetical protein [Streptomyces sp. B-S-A6]MDI3406246.1 hypothetical protein [Streptomyces sp. B-S-A6]